MNWLVLQPTFRFDWSGFDRINPILEYQVWLSNHVFLLQATKPMNPRPAIWRIFYRILVILIHVGINLPLTMLTFIPPGNMIRFGGRTFNKHMQCWWSGATCRIFGLRRRIIGEFKDGPQFIAVNHISWLDIQLLHSFSQMGFVAKAEIERWPLAGWIARFGETVFHRRGSHDSASGVSTVMAQRLQQGLKIAIFPEGGISPGHEVRVFHARMFRAAVDAQCVVQPVMVRYMDKNGRDDDISFRDGESMLKNFFRMLARPGAVADLHFLPVIDATDQPRRILADAARAAVIESYND